jgi:hypothetical protein
MEEVVHATGHEHVTASHESTFELTSDDFLTPAGDCILGIEADRTPAAFDSEFVAACQSPDATIVAVFETPSRSMRVEGRGDPELTFESDRSLVGRTSDYVDDRTIMVGADAAAAEFDRELVDALADGAPVTLTLTVE